MSCEHSTDNRSDHSPLFVKIRGLGSDVIQSNANNSPKLQWAKASPLCLERYGGDVERLLNSARLQVSECTDPDCSNEHHLNELDEYAEFIIEVCTTASDCVPKSSHNAKRKRIPGWNQFVKPLHEKAMFWHMIWNQNGRPQQGVVADIRRHTRSLYHKAVKKTMRLETELRYRNMSQEFNNKEKSAFWTEVKKMRGGSKVTPSNVDGAVGEKEIAKLFKEKYCELFTSVDYDVSEMQTIQETNNSKINEHCNNVCNAHVFSTADVAAAVKKLKRNKYDGARRLYSDHLINAPACLLMHITRLFNGMLLHGFSPGDFKNSVMTPIPKNLRKSVNDSTNYRSIALSSILGKVFDKVLLMKCKTVFTSTDYQFGYKAKLSTGHCSFVVDEVINRYKNNGSTVYACLLDASKAFDRLDWICMFNVLIKKELCPLVTRLLIRMYCDQTACVRWGNSQCDNFPIRNGVKQGGVLSPIMFTLYLDVLINRLKNAKIGCHVGSLYCGAFAYADDVVLLSPSIHGLRTMLKICADYATEYKLRFNASKSRMLVFSNAPHVVITPLEFMGGAIEIVKTEKHLGILIGSNSMSERIKALCNEITCKTNMICSHFKYTAPDCLYFLFKTYAMPLYGSQMIDLDCQYVDKLNVTWRKAIRHLLNLPYRTHCNLLNVLCQDLPFTNQLCRRYVKFFTSLNDSSNNVVKMCARLALYGSGSTVSNSLSFISNFVDTPRYQFREVDKLLGSDEEETLLQRASLVSDLLFLRHEMGLPNHWSDDNAINIQEVDLALSEFCCN